MKKQSEKVMTCEQNINVIQRIIENTVKLEKKVCIHLEL